MLVAHFDVSEGFLNVEVYPIYDRPLLNHQLIQFFVKRRQSIDRFHKLPNLAVPVILLELFNHLHRCLLF